ITIDPVSRLWHRFEGGTLHVPSHNSIDSVLALVDYRKLIVRGSSVELSTRGGSIDLGATAKGYAVDRGIAVLESLGATGGLIDAGGDIRAFGGRPDGRLWRIGVRDPRMPDSIVTVFEVKDRSIATSGDYERYFIRDGIRYHHILDPSTGFPARGCCSVTIITEKALDADAIATAVFVMGPQKGMRLIESLPDVEGLIIVCDDKKKSIIRSPGLEEYEKRR
ncbi:MAG: FAD:protein FMN transferase, partial [bacterium]